MKIGIFGGSFNPIHNSHLSLIREILKRRLVDEVWIIPCKRHPFDKSLASAKDRVRMISLAIKGIKKAKICKIELKSKGKNYTISTLRKLKKRYKHNFLLIIGSDILYEFKKWHKYKKLLKEANFIIINRRGYKIKKIPGMIIAHISIQTSRNFSSSEIRNRISKGKSIKNLVPYSIERYIKKRGLYK